MAINSTPFLTVYGLDSPHAIATTDSYLYIIVTGGVVYRSADGVDWEETATITFTSSTFVEGTTRIVLTGATTQSMAKNGTTWSNATGIIGTTVGGRFVGGKYFVWGESNYYYSTDGMAWTAGNPARVVKDIGYDGVAYVILAADRIYKSTNLITFTSYPLPAEYTGKSICYVLGRYYLSVIDNSSNYIIIDSLTLDSFSVRWYSPVVGYLQSVDGALFFTHGNTVNPQEIGHYVYAEGMTAPVLIALGYATELTTAMCLSRQIVIKSGYVYRASGESIQRAVYNTGWNTQTGTIQGTLRLDTASGAFADRTVYLYDYTTGVKLAETTSNETTGAWEFTALPAGEYFVVGVASGADLSVPRDFDALGVITVA